VKHSVRTSGVAATVAMLAALIAWPAGAANTLNDDEFLAMTNSQADETDMPGTSQAPGQVQQPAQAAVESAAPAAAAATEVAAISSSPAATATSGAENSEITAARLGVMTPYGKRALVQELRNYYPGSYREFRTLDGQQVNELVMLFEQTGNLNQVLAKMDRMVTN